MVAEHMMMQMLALAKRVRELMVVTQEAADFGRPPRRSDEDTFAYNWSGYRGVRGLWGSTVGILGMGEIGAELARRLRPFDCALLYNKRNPLPAAAESDLGARFVTVDEMLARSDVICMLLPFLPETEQSLSAAFFAATEAGQPLCELWRQRRGRRSRGRRRRSAPVTWPARRSTPSPSSPSPPATPCGRLRPTGAPT